MDHGIMECTKHGEQGSACYGCYEEARARIAELERERGVPGDSQIASIRRQLDAGDAIVPADVRALLAKLANVEEVVAAARRWHEVDAKHGDFHPEVIAARDKLRVALDGAPAEVPLLCMEPLDFPETTTGAGAPMCGRPALPGEMPPRCADHGAPPPRGNGGACSPCCGDVIGICACRCHPGNPGHSRTPRTP